MDRTILTKIPDRAKPPAPVTWLRHPHESLRTQRRPGIMQRLGPLAQQVEQLTFNQEVTGSIPVRPTGIATTVPGLPRAVCVYWSKPRRRYQHCGCTRNVGFRRGKFARERYRDAELLQIYNLPLLHQYIPAEAKTGIQSFFWIPTCAGIAEPCLACLSRLPCKLVCLQGKFSIVNNDNGCAVPSTRGLTQNGMGRRSGQTPLHEGLGGEVGLRGESAFRSGCHRTVRVFVGDGASGGGGCGGLGAGETGSLAGPADRYRRIVAQD